MSGHALCGRDCLQDGRSRYFESEQHGEELELVSEQHGVADDGHLGLQCVLDGHRGNVLPTCSDNQLCAGKKSNILSLYSDVL